MYENVAIPRSSAQWVLENLKLNGSTKVQLFQSLSKVHLEPVLAEALKQACREQLQVLNFGGAGEGTEIVSQLKTLLEQLEEG
mgnify:CR=1|tara:strand:+ start:18915 stop:19163 length:249 start_codon:yes stop_codon:yes gene_type:complete